MSNNSRIQRAILINWKGMFFQPFEIDPGMTILEGANGTGKTTIMIAIYTCLIPDLNFLNFQNVTTVSSRKNEDKGLYGRIGQDEKNRDEPIFSVLDIVTSSGSRHLVGVQLIKKTYPQVSLKHFAISNLSLEADVEQLLIHHNTETNQQEIPELAEIGAACKPFGGELISFRHAKDYFQFMFDNDISPIRLIENEERKKYNQLLHTSLYGGLSRTLQTSLRDYLLPENDKLVQGIHEMEQNLKTCRRTRSAIQRYQSVREVIRQVYETGLKMYASAFFATRLEAEQKVSKALKSREEKKALKLQWQTCIDNIESIRQQQIRAESDLAGKTEEQDLARQRLNRCLNASKINTEYQAKKIEYEKQLLTEEAARATFQNLKARENEFHTEERNLSAQQRELAKQLSDAGKAWQELSKQVGLYQQAEKLLAEARNLLNSDELTPETLDSILVQHRSTLDQVKEEHQTAYFKLSDATLKQEHFSNYFNILKKLTGEDIDPGQAGVRAKEVAAELTDLELRIKDADELPAKIGQLNENVRNRKRLLNALISVDLSTIDSQEQFEAQRETLLSGLKELKTRQKENQVAIESKTSELRAITDRIPALEKQLGEWDRFQKLKKELEDKTAASIGSARELAILQSSFEDRLQRLNLEKYELKARQKRIQQKFNTLLNEGSTQPGLKALAEQGYGSLLADKYEEIPADWAANLESRLGPLTNALLVKNIHKVANELTGSFDRPDDIWLVEEGTQEKLPEAVEMTDSILVKHGDAWRLSRLPEHPTLGKLARAQQIEILGQKIKELSVTLEQNDLQIQNSKEHLSLLNKLSLMEALHQPSSPLEQIKSLRLRQQELEKELKQLEADKNRNEKQIGDFETQEDVLRQYYPLRELLNASDLEKQHHDLQKEWEETQELEASQKHKFPLLAQLNQGIEVLQSPMEQELANLQQAETSARKRLDGQRELLEILERLNSSKDCFKFKQQVELLEQEKSISQHTESQLEAVEKKLSDLNQAIENHANETKVAGALFHKEEARLNTIKGQLELLQDNLSQSGASGSPQDLEQARKSHADLETESKKLAVDLNGYKEKCYQLDAELNQLNDNLAKAKTRFKNHLSSSRPVLKKWTLFHRQARNDQKFEALLAEYVESIQNSGKQPEVFWRKVSALRVSLVSTLEKIHDAKAVLEQVREISALDPDDADQAGVSLRIWQQIRNYIAQVIPVDLQTNDPEKAQDAIGQKLQSLEQNLEQQEHSLRIHVQAIPSHLNAEIRKQKSRIRKLNEKLDTVRFGFLQTIRINIETHPKLKRFLDILPQQLDIFAETNEENVSIEALMADLYEKEGAGKVRGDLLMDYRHYVRLSIEVKREGNQDFEKVTSTNLSTGESIGVGIAILIMVLMSWEEQSHLTKESENRGSLRFLLLDESSRLDQKALHTLTDFCSSLGLQLLIAAPSVERSLRGTTHHLTRGYFDGKEEVVVRGRRITADVS